MITKLFTYNNQLNRGEAILFYCVHFAIGILLAMGLSFLLECFQIINSIESGLIVGNGVAVIFCISITALICFRKNLFRKPAAYFYLLLSLIFSALAGILLGFIIPAYLSTIAPIKSTMQRFPTSNDERN